MPDPILNAYIAPTKSLEERFFRALITRRGLPMQTNTSFTNQVSGRAVVLFAGKRYFEQGQHALVGAHYLLDSILLSAALSFQKAKNFPRILVFRIKHKIVANLFSFS